MTVWRLVERYALHGMGSVDAQMLELMQQVLKQMQQQAAAQQTPLPAWFPGLWNSPEALAAMTLAGYAMLAVMLMLVSAVGGGRSAGCCGRGDGSRLGHARASGWYHQQRRDSCLR